MGKRIAVMRKEIHLKHASQKPIIDFKIETVTINYAPSVKSIDRVDLFN